MTQRTKAELLLVATTFIWGSTFVIVKGALADIAPFPFIAVRFILAGLLMFGIMAKGHLLKSVLEPSLLLGIILFLGYAFQTYGLIYTTPSKSAFITGFSVILVPLIARFQGFPMRRSSAAGAAFGLLGLYFLVMPSGIGTVNRGDILTLLGATAFAIHIVKVATYTRRHSSQQLASAQILVVGIFALLAVPVTASWTVRWTTGLVAAVVVTAIFATAFAFGSQVWAQQYTPPAHTALIFALEPVFAALTSHVVTREHLGTKVLLGAGLILAGMVVSEIWGASTPSPVEG